MIRSLYSYAIPNRILLRLVRAGFISNQDCLSSSVETISSETGISSSEIEEVIRLLQPRYCDLTPAPNQRRPFISCLERLENENGSGVIRTFSRNINKMLGGGFALGKITEVCGLPGTGKTQLCLQLCVNVQTPIALGGPDGEALYIDNEGNFSLERLLSMSEASVTNCQEMASTSGNQDVRSFSVDAILKGIHYLRCLDHVELIAAINTLSDHISDNPKTKLIVIDNIAFHFRHLEANYNQRNSILHHFFQQFLKLTLGHNLAVVVSNSLTTRIHNGSSRLVPALGECWSHFACNRLLLQLNHSRTVTLEKSSYLPRRTVPFFIASTCITDPPQDEEISKCAPKQQNSDMTTRKAKSDDQLSTLPHKRSRCEISSGPS